ncbi:hypothetical protein MY9_3429 [Bacillus sp. JS]|nr:hypothetical protein MY9_3429 [Bacillus sp. JS]
MDVEIKFKLGGEQFDIDVHKDQIKNEKTFIKLFSASLKQPMKMTF